MAKDGIRELIKNRASSIGKEEKKIFEEYNTYVDPEQEAKLKFENFEGHKGGISAFATELYTDTARAIDKIHEKNGSATGDKKLGKEELQASILEAIVIDNIKKLKKNGKAQDWVNHYETLKKKGGFHNNQDRMTNLIKAAQESLNLDKEQLQYLQLAANAAAEGDQTQYRNLLRAFSGSLEENLYSTKRQVLAEKIGENLLLSEKAQAYFASKTLADHGHYIKDSETFLKKDFQGHAEDYHKLKQRSVDKTKKAIEAMGYELAEDKK